MDTRSSSNSSNKRVRRNESSKRAETACTRCHAHKIRCSGTRPCTACERAKSAEPCRFVYKDTNVPIPKSYLKRLQEESEELRRRDAATRSKPDRVIGEAPGEQHDPDHVGDSEVSNPLLENQNGLFSGQPSTEPVFVGEGSCTAFGDRLLHCVDERFDSISSNTIPDHLQHAVCDRLLDAQPELPDRSQANILIWRALRFIGTDYHLCLRVQFFQQLDHAYAAGRPYNLHWACQLYALMGIGEMYSHCSHGTANTRVPGSDFFLKAVSLIQDRYEEPSIQQVHALLLLSFYANVLGRVKTAHVYAGIAMRLAVGLGLHRSQLGTSNMDPVQRENRRRVWWTLYLFDRLTASKLGYPLAIQDDDIDVEMPSMAGLSDAQGAEFAEPEHLCANVRLARITGKIVNDIYSPPRRHSPPFIRRVHRLLRELSAWNERLPRRLAVPRDHRTPRGVCSLHMLYDLCIIQTTRPILLHVFRTRLRAGREPDLVPPERPGFSRIALELAESCVQAARALNATLAGLFVAGDLAVFGYFDTHYLFSSTLVLMMSEAMEGWGQAAAEAATARSSSTATSDAIATALYLLRLMAGSGNVAAGDYLGRLGRVRNAIRGERGVVGERDVCGSGEGALGARAGVVGVRTFGAGDGGDQVLMGAGGGRGFGADDALGNQNMVDFLADPEFGVPLPEETYMQEFPQMGVWDDLTDLTLLGLGSG